MAQRNGQGNRLALPFYQRPALTVARELLGKVLVVAGEAGWRSGRIVETEAYVGAHDLACHAAKGRTARTEVMFGPGGHAYVYFIYGMHFCFNAVTGPEGEAAAVLVRAVEPLDGLPADARTDGPGRLCRQLGITRAHNGLSLLSDALHLVDAPPVPEARVERGPRVGVDYAGEWARKPFRLWVRDSRHVSRGPPRPAR
ncbi:MAG: DNA-3-methyladenine glycosylase [Myxococcaceae bacterium]|nr:DNA-3-methyladenine glycosylase [Myxococcaceae bacterium]